MSDEPETDPTETPDAAPPDTEAAEDAEGAATSAARSATPRVGMQGLLTRDSDLTVRPGFRNPANTRSKASRRKKGKKRR